MLRIVKLFFFCAITPFFLQAKSLLPAHHQTCLNAHEASSLALCGNEADFFVDQNGRCGCLSLEEVVQENSCANTQCDEPGDGKFSSLYRYRIENSFYEIAYAGCGCFSSDDLLPSLTHEGKPLAAPEPFVVVPCSESDLLDAITAANLVPSTTLNLASNCTYLYSTTYNLNELFPPISTTLTIIGGEHTVIKRHDTADLVRIFSVDTGATLNLKNLTIDNAYSNGLGGGVYNQGTLSLEKVTVSNNHAANGAGVASAFGAVTTISESEFIFNIALSVGGGGLIDFGTTTVEKSLFYANTAPINGGGLNVQPSGITTIISSSFSDNSSGSLGGGMSNLGTLNVDHSAIRYNVGTGGGGIATGNENVTLSLAYIVNNVPDNCSPLNTIADCEN